MKTDAGWAQYWYIAFTNQWWLHPNRSVSFINGSTPDGVLRRYGSAYWNLPTGMQSVKSAPPHGSRLNKVQITEDLASFSFLRLDLLSSWSVDLLTQCLLRLSVQRYQAGLCCCCGVERSCWSVFVCRCLRTFPSDCRMSGYLSYEETHLVSSVFSVKEPSEWTQLELFIAPFTTLLKCLNLNILEFLCSI